MNQARIRLEQMAICAACVFLGVALLSSCSYEATPEVRNPSSSLSGTANQGSQSHLNSTRTPLTASTPTVIPFAFSSLSPSLLRHLPYLTATHALTESPGILWSPSTNSAEIWLLDPRQNKSILLAETKERTSALKWSTDRSRFVFAAGSRIWLGALDGSKPIEVVSESQPIWQLQWIGPNLIHYCKRIYDARFNPCFIYNIETQSTNEGISIPSWSNPLSPIANNAVEIAPDYRHAVFLLEGDPTYYLVDLMTGTTSSIFTSSFEIPREGQIYGRWSHDGRQFAFVVTRFDSDLRGFDNHLYIVNADGSELREVLNFNTLLPNRRLGSPVELEWSPDDQWLSFIFSSDYGTLTPSTIHVVQVSSGELIDLEAPIENTSSHPKWSPDGKHLVYVTKNTGSTDYDLYMVDISSKNITRLTWDGYNKFHFDW